MTEIVTEAAIPTMRRGMGLGDITGGERTYSTRTCLSKSQSRRYHESTERRTSHHRDLVVRRCIRPDEPVYLLVDGALVQPLIQGVEKESVDMIRHTKKVVLPVRTLNTHTHTFAIGSIRHRSSATRPP